MTSKIFPVKLNEADRAELDYLATKIPKFDRSEIIRRMIRHYARSFHSAEAQPTPPLDAAPSPVPPAG